MGTQFWWFYDVLAVSISVGVLYVAVQKGINKTMFPLIGFLVQWLWVFMAVLF